MNNKLVRNRLMDLGISINAFCAQIQVSRTTFYKYVEGDAIPSAELLKKTANALGVLVEDLQSDKTDKEIIQELKLELARKNRVIDELLEQICYIKTNSN